MLLALRQSALRNHGVPSYDFDQAQLPYYAAMVALGGGAAARPGLCTALSIAWLDIQKNHQMRALRSYATDPVGSAFVTTVTNRIVVAAAGWMAQADWEMQQLQFTPVNHMTFPQMNFQQQISNTQYGIFVASQGAASHAMGVHKMNDAINFFDPNEGEVAFRHFVEFLSWFDDFRVGALTPHFGNWYNCHVLRYT
jgi:hypothetical protein